MLREEEPTGKIITCFFRVYDELGFGFLESVYQRAMAFELTESGLVAEPEVLIEVLYRGEKVGHFRADLMVERKVILEIKASQALADSDRTQLFNYLRGSQAELGLLLHFGPKGAL